MPSSQMPKGVEHKTGVALKILLHAVPSSLMPQGVEHSLISIPSLCAYFALLSLMPQGVEHWDYTNDYASTLTRCYL